MLCMVVSMAGGPIEKRKVEQLYEKYNRLMYTVAYNILKQHEDAEDAVLASWEKIIRHLDKISEIECKETKNFIVIIVERTSIDIHRAKSRKQEVFLDEYEEMPYYATQDREIQDFEMAEFFRSMPKKYGEVLMLKYINNLSHKEIAEILNLREGTVSSRLSRAQKMLQEVLENGR